MATVWTQTAAGSRSGRAVQSATETAPTSSSAVGVSLDGVESVTAIIHAPTGQTFDGTGTLLGYSQPGSTWVRAPRADIDLGDFAGLSDAALPSLAIYAASGRFIYIPSGVGLSGGTSITTEYLCTTRAGRTE